MAPASSDSPSLPPPEGSARPVAAPGGEDGPFPVPSVPEVSSGRTWIPAPADVCGFIHNQWDIGRNLRRCIADAGHTQGRFAYDHGPWERVPNRPADSAPDASSTSPAAPVPAVQRPEVAGEPESGQDGAAGRVAARCELAGKDTVAVPRWEYDLMTQQQERAAKAEATIERMKRTNRMVNGGARDSRERAERAEVDLEALRLKVADLERIAAGPQPPEQDSTGWQWLCHRCDLGADGHFTRRGALRAQRKHLDAAHR